ncbi:hypothetical protein ACH4A8_37515 [Streptomyces vietnamensis]|uniref:hypothetical protein n=1 Tax=Streptomyces vietnamensis TaxID=362257 RepID=UPI003799A1D3
MNGLTHHRAVVVTVVALLLWAAGEGIAAAADPAGEGGDGILGPLNVTSSEGVPIDRYELDPMEQHQEAQGGPEDQGAGVVAPSMDSVGGIVRNFLASGLFALSRTATGFACWLIDQVYDFPIIEKLTGPAQHISDAYERDIIGPLGLAGITLAWAFVFGLVMIMRGRVARGAGELLLSLLISAVTATTLVQPAVLLGYEGPVQQSQRAALEAATITTNAGNTGPRVVPGPCAAMHGDALDSCLRQEQTRTSSSAAAAERDRIKRCEPLIGSARQVCLRGEKPLNAADVSVPITRTLTDSLVVQPYMLLQYGRVLEKGDPLYKAHTTLIATEKQPDLSECSGLTDVAQDLCESAADQVNTGLIELDKAGPEGKAVVERMLTPDWDKVLGALLVLIAAIIIVLVVVTMALALIAAQFGCVIAAIGAVVVFPVAILPGPGRGLLWKWLGYLAGCMLVLVATAVFIPLFGIAAKAVFADSNSTLLERLLILDGLVLTALVMYKRIVRGSRAVGTRLAQRMSYAKIGGSHMMGGGAADTAAAFSALGLTSATGSPAHATLLGRSGFAAQAVNAARGSLTPFQLGLKAAHMALIGPKRPAAKPAAVGPDGRPLPPTKTKSAPGPTDTVTAAPGGSASGRVTVAPHDRPIRGRHTPSRLTHTTSPQPGQGQEGVVPAGARLEAALRTTRGGRVLVATSKAVYHSTLGLPATWNRAARVGNTRASALGAELGRQRDHYRGARQRWVADTRAGLGFGRTPDETPTGGSSAGGPSGPQPPTPPAMPPAPPVTPPAPPGGTP